MKNENWKDIEQLRVLAVDDHQINCEFIKAALSPLVESISIARNGRQAIELCRQKAFDIVLMDLHMPDMDGISSWEQITHLNHPQSAPRVIALTAEKRPEERTRLQNAGFHGYLYKPVSVDLLTHTLLKVANGHSGFSHMIDEAKVRSLLLDDRRAINTNGSAERAVQMRKALSEDLNARFELLDQAMREGRFSDAAELLHQWAGAAGYAGASRLQKACTALEASLRNDLDSSPGLLYLDVVRRIECTVQSIQLNRPIRA